MTSDILHFGFLYINGRAEKIGALYKKLSCTVKLPPCASLIEAISESAFDYMKGNGVSLTQGNAAYLVEGIDTFRCCKLLLLSGMWRGLLLYHSMNEM